MRTVTWIFPNDPVPPVPGSPPPVPHLQVGREIGRGGFGVVHKGTDIRTGDAVAIKSISGITAVRRRAFERECEILSMLRIPGVVRMRESFAQGEKLWLVMDFVDGEHFPQSAGSWEELVPAAAAVLHVVRRLHNANVFHRDIKPANVLMQGGKATLIDFGVSLLGGPNAGDGFADAGSPHYLPEGAQKTPSRNAARDIYALGVMFTEALLCRKLGREERSDAIFRRVGAHLPAHVRQTLASMCATDPTLRPPDVETVMRLLHLDVRVAKRRPVLPFVGQAPALRAVLDAARARRRVRVGGGPGTGRTRFLTQAAFELKVAGFRPHWVQAGEEPLTSLAQLEPPAGMNQPHEIKDWLLHRLADRGVLLADAGVLDRTTRLLFRQFAEIPVVWITDRRPDVSLLPLSKEDLRAAIRGAQGYRHLADRAATLIHERTGGKPTLVVAETLAWVRDGHARLTSTGLRPAYLSILRKEFDRRHDVTVPPMRFAASHHDGPILRLLNHDGQGLPLHVVERHVHLSKLDFELRVAELVEDGVIERDGDLLRAAARSRTVFLLAPWEMRATYRLLAFDPGWSVESRWRHVLKTGDVDQIIHQTKELVTPLMAAHRWGEAESLCKLAITALDDLNEVSPWLASVTARAALTTGGAQLIRECVPVLEQLGCDERHLCQAATLFQQKEFLHGIRELLRYPADGEAWGHLLAYRMGLYGAKSAKSWSEAGDAQRAAELLIQLRHRITVIPDWLESLEALTQSSPSSDDWEEKAAAAIAVADNAPPEVGARILEMATASPDSQRSSRLAEKAADLAHMLGQTTREEWLRTVSRFRGSARENAYGRALLLSSIPFVLGPIAVTIEAWISGAYAENSLRGQHVHALRARLPYLPPRPAVRERA